MAEKSCVACGTGKSEFCDKCIADIEECLNRETPRKQAYENYLSCVEWKFLRTRAYLRAKGKCELCGEPPDAVHHIKYPRHYTEDNLKNLLVVCAECHTKVHGIWEGGE